MNFEEQYPNKPPSVKFISQMFHPNVYATGELCLDILQNRWSPTYDVAAVLTSIQRWVDMDIGTCDGRLVADTALQLAQRPKHRIPRERRSVQPVQRQPQGVHKEGEGDGGEELGRLRKRLGCYPRRPAGPAGTPVI